MIEFFINDQKSCELRSIESIEKGCWINIVSPTEDEIKFIQEKLSILPNFLIDPLDDEEKPRIDVEDDQTLIIVDTPYLYENGSSLKFETIPLGLLITSNHFITISSQPSNIIEKFREKKIKDFYTFKKTRFTLQILFSIAKDFLKYLRHIDKKTDDLEKSLHKSMKNKELFKLLELEKSLVYFTTSLKSNEIVMEKLMRSKIIKMYEEDQDLLEDVIIENRQALEMSNIYGSILGNMMGTFASVISNNLNIVMKFLTSVTIVMAIPTMVSSFFGMNLKIPFGLESQYGFMMVFLISLLCSAIAVFILSRSKLF
ncbi:MAG: magnesium transporter CorA family protein [Clostridiales bacterium]